MLTYKPTQGNKGSWAQAKRECEAMLKVLNDPVKTEQYLKEFADWGAIEGMAQTPATNTIGVDVRLVNHEIINGKAVGGYLRIIALEYDDESDPKPA